MHRIKRGENGHTEYAAGNTFTSRVVQFNFQCVRTECMDILERDLESLLVDFKGALFRGDGNGNYGTEVDDYIDLATDLDNSSDILAFVSLYKMIGQTRDISSGKGERDLAYMMISVWYKHFESLALFALDHFVRPVDGIMFGSWKDIKKLCIYCLSRDGLGGLIDHCISLMVEQLRLDEAGAADSLSLCSRWVPRETSAKGEWLFKRIALVYYPEFVATAKNQLSLSKAMNKTFMTFSRLIARLNKQLDTVQIKMCGKKWAEIDHHKTPSVALFKNTKAFLNKSVGGPSTDPDRIQCAENLKAYIESRVSTGGVIKGKNVGLIDYIKRGRDMAFKLQDGDASRWGEAYWGEAPVALEAGSDSSEFALLNSQWDSFMSSVGDLSGIVAMVDQSGSMTEGNGSPYYAAIGLGLAVAEKSGLGRIMTFSTEPAWIPVKGTFLERMRIVNSVDHLSGYGTDFFKALKLVLDTCVSENIPDSIVSNMTLAIFSDMQIDAPYNIISDRHENMDCMYERILAMYLEKGYSGVPHILFWNLRSTTGYPVLSTSKNCTMFSGFSPALLNSFCEKGVESLAELNPWTSFVESLSNPRYLALENKAREFVKIR